MKAAFRTPQHSIIALTEESGHVVIVEPGHPLWAALSASPEVAPFAPEVPPAPTPDEIRATLPPLSRRQMFIALHRKGLITRQEAIAAAAHGTVPAALEARFAALPEPEQTDARVTFGAFQLAYRLDPLTRMIAEVGGLTEAELDAIWTGFAKV